MGLICMFIVPADFHTEYRNTMHSVASMALTFSMLVKPTPVTHLCRPVTYQPINEARNLLQGSLCMMSTEFLSLILVLIIWQKLSCTFTTLHFSHFVISFKKSLCLTFPLRFTRTRVK